jgi:hypothetical protein
MLPSFSSPPSRRSSVPWLSTQVWCHFFERKSYRLKLEPAELELPIFGPVAATRLVLRARDHDGK